MKRQVKWQSFFYVGWGISSRFRYLCWNLIIFRFTLYKVHIRGKCFLIRFFSHRNVRTRNLWLRLDRLYPSTTTHVGVKWQSWETILIAMLNCQLITTPSDIMAHESWCRKRRSLFLFSFTMFNFYLKSITNFIYLVKQFYIWIIRRTRYLKVAKHHY